MSQDSQQPLFVVVSASCYGAAMTEGSPKRRSTRKMQFGLGTLLLWTATVSVYLGCCKMAGISSLSFICLTLWIAILGITRMVVGELATVCVWAAAGMIQLAWFVIANSAVAPDWITSELSATAWKQLGQAWLFGTLAYIYLSATIRAAYRMGMRNSSDGPQ